MEYLFLGSMQDGEEFYLCRRETAFDGKYLFILYVGQRVYDIDTSLQSSIEDDELLADLEECYGPMLTNEYINDKKDLLINHYFHRLPGLDNIYFWDKPDREFQMAVKEGDIHVLMGRIQNICGVRTDDFGTEFTDFGVDYVEYDEVYDFIKDAFVSNSVEKKEEIKDVVYKHI